MSRSSKFIFACDIPPDPAVTPTERAQRRDELQRTFKAWGEVIGFEISMSDIEGGFRVTIKAETTEAKNRLIALGAFPAVTTAILDFRRIGVQVIVTAYADLPKGLEFFAMFPPDPSNPQIIEAQKNIAKLLGAPDGVCHLI